MSRILLELDQVSLVVPYFEQPEREGSSWLSTLIGAATSIPRRRFASLLDGVSFRAVEGDRIALIGRNGAGKSTTLRVLAGAFEPTRGRVVVEGSRQAILSMGLGFNPEATIRENVFLRGTAMRLTSQQISEILDPVLDFSGLREVANRRLMTLSSGQRMRLGFSISTAIQHDIMLLDEWFGAGDTQFVRKARERMSDRVMGSGIVVVASHNEALITRLCNRGILLDQGRVIFDGGVKEALKEYRALYPPPPKPGASKVAGDKPKAKNVSVGIKGEGKKGAGSRPAVDIAVDPPKEDPKP